jgi:predicted dienelactone hydrolase
MTEYLVTHGFVVAAPDHVGNTVAEQINKGNAIPAAKAAALRPPDVSRALDVLLAQATEPGGRLSGAVDEAHVGVAGHSFGGYTTLRIAGATLDTAAVLADCATNGGLICDGWKDVEMPASQADPRFVAALAQAPGGAQAMYGGGHDGFADVSMPVMIQGGTTDALTPWATEQEAPWKSLPAPASLLGIEAAGHFTFSDMCLLVEEIGLTVAEFEDGCGTDNMPYADGHAIINRYATAWFQHTLLGVDTSDTLDPTTPLGPGVASFQVK